MIHQNFLYTIHKHWPQPIFSLRIPAIEVPDEVYKLFHTIDRRLLPTLIHTLNCDLFDSISVVAFLLWLERSRLGPKAVLKVNQDWPNHLIDMLVDQVCAAGMVEESDACLGISMIRELCTEDVGFVYLHQRRLEILRKRTEIVNEMAEKAFKDMFPNGVVDPSVQDGVGQ
ncbi:uncharacterized protein LOC141686538 [Apium graveolens]|uniref:uncharacterized protein LOC141686538 n=1 Tax=Apium graveolens TaxID=4045 RepID=UPI003D7BC511